MENVEIPGYDFGRPGSAVSPVTDEELRHLERTVGWSELDVKLLRTHERVFREQAEAMVDSWRAVIGGQPHLLHWFTDAEGTADDEYKARVKRRFVQWVVDVAVRPHDRAWLNYQEEIGLRHTPAKKNAADGKRTQPLVPLRYLLGFAPVVLPVSRFFEDAITDRAERAALESAWTRAVLLHVTLWARPYTAGDLW